MNGAYAQHIKYNNHNKCSQVCIDTSRQGLRNTSVDQILEIFFFVFLHFLTDTVKDNNCCVDRISDDRQHTRDKCISDGHSGDHIERQHNKNVMHKCDDRTCSEPDILKPEPDINQHTDRSYNDRNNSVSTHLRTYSTTDIPDFNILLCHSVVIRHILCKCFSFGEIECLGLEYNLRAVLYSLHLNVRISCNILQIRNHLFIHFIQCIFLVKGYCRRRTANEVKTVIHSADSARMVDAHTDKSAHAQNNGNNEENSPFSEEIDRFAFFQFLCIQLLISDSDRIEGIDDQSCDKQRRKHGYYDTQSQRLRESSDCSASSQPQHCRRNQSCDVSVDNS